jgi:hypothetical protein
VGGQKKIWGHKSSRGCVRNLGGAREILGVNKKFEGVHEKFGGAQEI